MKEIKIEYQDLGFGKLAKIYKVGFTDPKNKLFICMFNCLNEETAKEITSRYTDEGWYYMEEILWVD